MELFLALSTFVRCTDLQSGRTSEASGIQTWTPAGGEIGGTTRVFPLGLWWEPAFVNYAPQNQAAFDAGIVKTEPCDAAGTVFAGWTTGGMPGDRTNPYLKLTFRNALSAVPYSVRWSVRVRGLGDPTPFTIA